MNYKKVFIEIILFILITILAITGYQVLAAATTEMVSEGIGYPAGFPVITYSDLLEQYDLLCSGHDVALPGANATIVSSGGESQAVPLPTEDQVLFSTGVTTNPTNPYTSTTSKTLGTYTSTGVVTAVPEEAYILAEMTENTNGNIGTFYNMTTKKYTGEVKAEYEIDINGEVIYGVNIDKNGQPQDYVKKQGDDYYYIEVTAANSDYFPYTYVQQAWWSTPAGSKGTAVKQNSFSMEAKAFEIYINSVRKGTETVDKTVTVNDKTVTVPAPEIEYNVTSTTSEAEVRYDTDTRKYLIGPFTINYPEWKTTSSDRGEVVFSGITDITLKGLKVDGSINEEITIDDSKWSIYYKNVREESGALAEYPHDGEEFYISLDYMENVTMITDILFDFEYMNAGATYENLEGTYNIVSWTPETEVVSDGLTKTYIHTLECTAIDNKTSQPFSLGLEAARWYENAEYSLFSATLRTPIPDEPSTPTYTPTPTYPYEPDEPYEPDDREKIKLTIPMEGEVWIDTPEDKATNTTEGKRDDQDVGYKNAEVYVYKVYRNSSGEEVDRELAKIYDEDNDKELSFPIYTDDDGKYTIPNILVPGTENKNNKYEICYDVVFKYDGQTYEASTVLPTANGDSATYINASRTEKDEKYAQDSLASEDSSVRNEFNEKFETISGGNAIDDNGNTVGSAGNLTLNYTSDTVSSDSTTKRVSELTTLDSNGHILEQYKMTASTANTGIYFPVNHKITKNNADEVVKTVDRENRVTTTTYHSIYNYMLHINLAVKEREESDLGVVKDLYKAELVVNEKEITKKYNTLVDFESDKYAEFLNIQLENAKTASYTLGLYSSDYEYRSNVYENEVEQVKAIKGDTDLKVYLTYKIAIYNEGAYDMVINSLNDYYDKTFTLVETDETATIYDSATSTRTEKVVAEQSYYRVIDRGQTPTYDYTSNGMANFAWETKEVAANEDYKTGTITAFNGLKLSPGQQLQLFVTYEVDKSGIQNGTRETDLLGEKNNVAEIASYSSYNTDGSVAGKIDKDSAPNNINLNKITDKAWYEDDTESAPAVNIELLDLDREINGVVWEDSETETIDYEQKVGNGIYDSDETGIPNIDVQLVEKIDIDGIEYEKIWTEDDIKTYFSVSDEDMENYKLDVVTGDDGTYTFKGVLAGNYVVRFKYGNKEESIKYNGQDYKNTAYQAGITDLNQEWQDIKSDSEVNTQRVSDARDYELQRMKVVAYSRTIGNEIGTVLESADNSNNHDDLIANTQMVANTAKLNLEIEPADYITYGTNKEVDGTQSYTYTVKDIDFGLEKRSETSLELDKSVSKITLYKQDGSEKILEVIFNEDGSIDREKSTESDKLLPIPETASTQGLNYINIEKSYLNNLSIQLDYKIKVTNTSEVDWTGELANYTNKDDILAKVSELEQTEEYKSGDITYGTYVGMNYYTNKNSDTDKIVTTNVEQVIDYIDNNIGLDSNENTNVENHSWETISVNDLQDKALLSDSVYTTVDGTKTIVDSDGVSFEGTGKANIVVTKSAEYNPLLVAALVPEKANTLGTSSGEITITTSKITSSDSDADDLSFNNIAEILQYSNTVGRRDSQAVPGNAQVSRGAYVAATGYENGSLVEDYEGAKEVEVSGTVKHLNGERDTDAADLTTFTEPTGLTSSEVQETTYMFVILIAGIVLAAGIFIIKKTVVNKKNVS